MLRKLKSFFLPLLTTMLVLSGFASFIFTIYDTNDNINENAVVEIDRESRYVAYIENDGNNTKYTSIEKALDDAAEKGGEQTVFVIPGISSPSNPIQITRDCTISSGVTLAMPYEFDDNNKPIYEPDKYGFSIIGHNPFDKIDGFSDDNETYIKTYVLVKSGFELNISTGGTLKMGGFRRSTVPQGSTGGNHVQLVLEEYSMINCYGTIDCDGYIKESFDNNSSQINIFSSGKLMEPLVIYDWSSASNTQTYLNNGIFPFNLFELPQVSVKIRIYSGGVLNAKAWITGTRVGDVTSTANLIGGTDDGISLLISNKNVDLNDYIDWKSTDKSIGNSIIYNSGDKNNTLGNHKTNIDVCGEYNLESMTLDVQSGIGSVPIDSSEYFLPFSSIFDINIISGVFNINNRIKFLPGSEITIGKNAIANAKAGIAVFNSHKNSSGQAIASYLTNQQAAYFENNGTFYLKSGSFFGKIHASLENGDENSKIIVGDVQCYATTKELTNYDFTDSLKADIKFAQDTSLISDYDLLPNTTYMWEEDEQSNKAFWYIPGYVLNFNILSGSGGNINDDFSFDVRLNNNDNEIYSFNNNSQLYLRVEPGTTFEIINPVNISSFKFEDESDVMFNTVYTANSSINFNIKPNEINAVDKIDHVSIYNATYNSLDDSYTYGSETTLNLKAKFYDSSNNEITDVSGLDIEYNWSVDNVEQSEKTDNFEYTFNQEENNKTYEVALSVSLKVNNAIVFEGDTSIKITINKDPGCFSSGTLITTNNGEKKVEDLTRDDLILTFNHYSGEYEYKPILMLINHGDRYHDVIELNFNDNTIFEAISHHSLFDISENKYVVINETNYNDYIGHYFLKYENGSEKIVTLTSVNITKKYTGSYTLITDGNYNCLANNLLNITPSIKGFYNIFDYDENHVYNALEVEQAIEEYGLYSYDYWQDYIDYDVFIGFNVPYLKISVGKGLVNEEYLFYLIRWYYSMIESGEAIIY